MKHISCPEIEGIDSLALGLEGSAKMIVKPVSGNAVCIEIQPGGHTPDHRHDDGERVIVMSGSGELKLERERRDINPGDYLEFEANEQHQIISGGDDVLVFMCFRNQ